MTQGVFSSQKQRAQIASIIESCARLPVSNDAVPGAFLETVLAHVRGAKVLATYDYVDVIDTDAKVGWSVKSTKAATPMTWKRAKLPNKTAMITASKSSDEGKQLLGNALINFCNDHAVKSMETYNLSSIGYCRLIVHDNYKATYFERLLCTYESPLIFNPDDFEWKWSVEKTTNGKEQLVVGLARFR
jgi:hypothetical protein